MEDVKPIIAKNIATLRQNAGLTQLEFAAKLNYSDKAISKWERGESVPDVSVLMKIAELFGVTLNYLVEPTHTQAEMAENKSALPGRHNKKFVTGIAILLVWLVATFCFVMLNITVNGVRYHWLAFVCAVPVSMIVWLVFNSIWFNKHLNYLIITFLMWSGFAAIYLICLAFGYNLWLLFVIGAPAQVVILLWSRIKYKQKK